MTTQRPTDNPDTHASAWRNAKTAVPIALAVVAASFVPVATTMAGITLSNHNETLLLDA